MCIKISLNYKVIHKISIEEQLKIINRLESISIPFIPGLPVNSIPLSRLWPASAQFRTGSCLFAGVGLS